MAKSVSRYWAALLALFLGVMARGGEAADGEAAAWQYAQSQNTEAAYRAFLRDYPEGSYTDEAFRKLVGIIVRNDTPLFAPAFDNDLLIEGIVPSAMPHVAAQEPAASPPY
jgi:hypothetical protein